MTAAATDPRRKYKGNIYFYKFCSLNRSPLFLQRNLRKVLAAHRRSLARVRTRPSTSMKNGLNDEHGRGHITTSDGTKGEVKAWSVQEIQDALIHGAYDAQHPYLRINITDIKDKLAQFRDLEIPRNQLTKRVKVPSVRANCSLTIWRRAGQTVVEQVRVCEIHSKTLASGERWASVTLESPFEVPIEDLKPRPDAPQQIGDGPSFSLELKLMADNLTDSWPPVDLKRVPPPKKAFFYEGDELIRLPILIAKWHRLPDIPRSQKESMLDLRAYQTSPSDQSKFVDYIPKLGLVVDIDWYVTPSPLQRANHDLQRKLSPTERPGIEPQKRTMSSPQAKSPSPEFKSEISGHTEWIFEGILDTVPARNYPAYHCPFCPLRHSKTENRMRRFGGADEFCIHLRNNHSALRWEYVPRYRVLEDGLQVVHDGKINIRPCAEYDEPATGNKGTDPRELSWLRPKEPLDIEAFLKGDESWIGKKKRLNVADVARNPDGSRSKASDHVKTETVRRRRPEDVPNIPPRPRRTFKVPSAPPGVRFYRNITKRELEEGESVSESDDDIDEDWLLQKHSDTIDSFTDTTRSEKEFIHRFDRHVLREDLASDLHQSEALVRFCRQNFRWLRRDDMRLEFHKKIASLKIQGSISGRVIWTCMDIINSGIDEDLQTDSGAGLAKGNTIRFNYGPDPIEKGHTYGQCRRCHNEIRDPRKLVRCSNPTCLQPEYHLACVNLTVRPSSWRCPRCLSAPPPSAAYGPWRSPTFGGGGGGAGGGKHRPFTHSAPLSGGGPPRMPARAPSGSGDPMELTSRGEGGAGEGFDGASASPRVNGHASHAAAATPSASSEQRQQREREGHDASSGSESNNGGGAAGEEEGEGEEGSSQDGDSAADRDRRRSNRHRRVSGRAKW